MHHTHNAVARYVIVSPKTQVPVTPEKEFMSFDFWSGIFLTIRWGPGQESICSPKSIFAWRLNEIGQFEPNSEGLLSEFNIFYHQNNSIELRYLNSVQTGQLISSFHTDTDWVNRVGTPQNTDWMMSNMSSLLLPTNLHTRCKMHFIISVGKSLFKPEGNLI